MFNNSLTFYLHTTCYICIQLNNIKMTNKETVSAVATFSKLVEIVTTSGSKKAVVDAYQALSTKEKINLLVYYRCRSVDQFFLHLRNYVENTLAR